MNLNKSTIDAGVTIDWSQVGSFTTIPPASLEAPATVTPADKVTSQGE